MLPRSSLPAGRQVAQDKYKHKYTFKINNTPRSSSPVRTPGFHPGNHGFESHTRYEQARAIDEFSSFCFLYELQDKLRGIRMEEKFSLCGAGENFGGRGIPCAVRRKKLLNVSVVFLFFNIRKKRWWQEFSC